MKKSRTFFLNCRWFVVGATAAAPAPLNTSLMKTDNVMTATIQYCDDVTSCSHCNRSVFGPFKTAYRKACDELMTNFPSSLVSSATFCGVLTKAWAEASPNIVWLSSCWIYPF